MAGCYTPDHEPCHNSANLPIFPQKAQTDSEENGLTIHPGLSVFAIAEHFCSLCVTPRGDTQVCPLALEMNLKT